MVQELSEKILSERKNKVLPSLTESVSETSLLNLKSALSSQMKDLKRA
jgi:hypothetical protein